MSAEAATATPKENVAREHKFGWEANARTLDEDYENGLLSKGAIRRTHPIAPLPRPYL